MSSIFHTIYKCGIFDMKGLFEMATFSERLKELRLERNLNQIELAERLGCNRQKIADMERGKTSPNVEVLMKLSEIFKTSTDYLLGLSDVSTTDVDIKQVCDYTGLNESSVNALSSLALFTNGKDLYSDNLKIINFFLQNEKFWDMLFEILQYKSGIKANSSDWQLYIDLIQKNDTQYLKKDEVFEKMNTTFKMFEISLMRSRDIFSSLINEFVSSELKEYNEIKQTAVKLLNELDCNKTDSSDNSNSDSGSDCSDSSGDNSKGGV